MKTYGLDCSVILTLHLLPSCSKAVAYLLSILWHNEWVWIFMSASVIVHKCPQRNVVTVCHLMLKFCIIWKDCHLYSSVIPQVTWPSIFLNVVFISHWHWYHFRQIIHLILFMIFKFNILFIYSHLYLYIIISFQLASSEWCYWVLSFHFFTIS